MNFEFRMKAKLKANRLKPRFPFICLWPSS